MHLLRWNHCQMKQHTTGVKRNWSNDRSIDQKRKACTARFEMQRPADLDFLPFVSFVRPFLPEGTSQLTGPSDLPVIFLS
mmetsp:Transcript_47832/g.94377  ORF Transcript_47832/g.94377 Transcript_47832/m.94377 type:complete len:80 (-) Transcript_47832:66-305(-)